MSTNEIELKKYQWLNEHTRYGRSNHGGKYVNFIRSLQPGSLLDIGTGDGAFCKGIKKYINKVYGLEWAIDIKDRHKEDGIEYFKCSAQKIPLPDKSVDVVTSFDFFEHVIPESVDEVLQEMVRVCKRAMFHTIATKPSGSYRGKLTQLFEDGELHQTQKDRFWWSEKFEEYGSTYRLNKGIYMAMCKYND